MHGEYGAPAARPAVQEFDAWYSVRTGKMRLVGVEIDSGGVLITREQLDVLREAAWGKKA